MDILIYVGIVISILLLINLFSIIQELLAPDIPALKDTPIKCSDKICAFYKVHENEGTVNEKASCFYGVKEFEEKYKGRSPCSKAISDFGEDPASSYNLLHQRKLHLGNLINRLASYISLILVIYRLMQGN